MKSAFSNHLRPRSFRESKFHVLPSSPFPLKLKASTPVYLRIMSPQNPAENESLAEISHIVHDPVPGVAEVTDDPPCVEKSLPISTRTSPECETVNSTKKKRKRGNKIKIHRSKDAEVAKAARRNRKRSQKKKTMPGDERAEFAELRVKKRRRPRSSRNRKGLKDPSTGKYFTF